MKINKFKIEGLLEFIPNIYADSRGVFVETYNKETLAEQGFDFEFKQDNQSVSHRGVFRGLHLQLGDSAQGKLVRVSRGSVYDIALDLRKDSETFGEWQGILLTEGKQNQFWVPPGFAHGFISLEDNTIFNYKCTEVYNKEAEECVRWDSTELDIDLSKFIDTDPLVSPKDLLGLTLTQYKEKYGIN